jgi:hypothetical protein
VNKGARNLGSTLASRLLSTKKTPPERGGNCLSIQILACLWHHPGYPARAFVRDLLLNGGFTSWCGLLAVIAHDVAQQKPENRSVAEADNASRRVAEGYRDD